MKKILYIVLALAMSVFAASCEYDNYDAPSITFSGNLVYNGENIQMDGNKSILRVIQDGFGKVDNGTNIQVAADGSFTQLLFSGTYRFTPYNNPYPWVFEEFPYLGSAEGYPEDTLSISKDYHRDLEVIPYYQINDFTATYNSANETILLSCNIVATDDDRVNSIRPALTAVRGYISTSKIVNSSTKCSAVWTGYLPSYSGPSTLEIKLSDYQDTYVNNFRDYGFCRFAIEVDNVPDYYIFSPVVKVEGLPVKKWTTVDD